MAHLHHGTISRVLEYLCTLTALQLAPHQEKGDLVVTLVIHRWSTELLVTPRSFHYRINVSPCCQKVMYLVFVSVK